MRIKLITYEKTELPEEEKFYIIDTEECKGYDITYDTISDGKSVKVEKEILNLYFNNGTDIRKDFSNIARFFVDGVEIIRHGSFTDKYAIIHGNCRLITRIDEEFNIDKIINDDGQYYATSYTE